MNVFRSWNKQKCQNPLIPMFVKKDIRIKFSYLCSVLFSMAFFVNISVIKRHLRQICLLLCLFLFISENIVQFSVLKQSIFEIENTCSDKEDVNSKGNTIEEEVELSDSNYLGFFISTFSLEIIDNSNNDNSFYFSFFHKGLVFDLKSPPPKFETFC